MILKILEHPNPILKQISQKVEIVDSEIKKFLDDMLETMYAKKGIGLAAPQVGVLKKIVVVDLSLRKEDEEGKKYPRDPMFLINPEIIEKSADKQIAEEGCLSVPNQCAEVERFYKIKVKFLDKDGTEQIKEFEEFDAVVIQHEMDHLDGKLYIDRISRLKRQMVLKKLDKFRQGEEA
ncbi:MAG: peptide deformylase [Alphaproteobacteria bacterium]